MPKNPPLFDTDGKDLEFDTDKDLVDLMEFPQPDFAHQEEEKPDWKTVVSNNIGKFAEFRLNGGGRFFATIKSFYPQDDGKIYIVISNPTSSEQILNGKGAKYLLLRDILDIKFISRQRYY